MKRNGILTAGGDTPAPNATIHGAVVRANQLKVEIVGLTRSPQWWHALCRFTRSIRISMSGSVTSKSEDGLPRLFACEPARLLLAEDYQYSHV